jgi:hypothetical protein
MTRIRFFIAAMAGMVAPLIAAERIARLSVPGAVLFTDQFEREMLGDGWQASQRSFAIKDGVMIGGMRDEATHPAIVKVSKDFRDIVLRFDFRFDGAKSFNIVFNDINEKSVHSGHVARMTVSPKLLTLTDDKSGLMSLEWVNKRNDPKFKEQVDQVRKEKSRSFPFDWQPGRWYTLLMEVAGDEMLVSIDGRPTAYFRTPGFGQPNKTSFHFSISGRDLSVDNLTAWKGAPDPTWNQRRDGVIGALKK